MAEAKIASVINTDAGKAFEVIGNVIHEEKPVIKVTSSFLYRGCFTDCENTFEIAQDPDYVPTPKEWFELRVQSKYLIAGTSSSSVREQSFLSLDRRFRGCIYS